MLLQHVATASVMIVFASGALGATFDCSARGSKICDCIRQPGREKTLDQFTAQMALYAMPKVTAILKKLKNVGCIEASMWPDVQVILVRL